MRKIYLDPERCKGCHYCIRACAKDALYISNHVNEKAYNTIAIDEEKCILCGACYHMCPDYVFEIK